MIAVLSCPWHYVLLTKLVGRSQAPSFCLQLHGSGQGSKANLLNADRSSMQRVHYLLWVTHPSCQREKDLLYFLPAPGSCCCCETGKTKHPLTVFIFRCVYSSCLIQYLTSIKQWDTTDFSTTFTDRPDSQECLERTCGCHLPHLLLEAELSLELNQISHGFV